MMRGSVDPASPYYAILVTPANGAVVQWRTTQGGASNQIAVPGTVPVYVEVSRWTDTSGATPVTYYSALTSADGVTWTTVPGSAVAMTLPANYLEGLAVTSHDTSQLSTRRAVGGDRRHHLDRAARRVQRRLHLRRHRRHHPHRDPDPDAVDVVDPGRRR